jgi:hypothetical protein
MKKELVVLLDHYTCQKNGVPFDEYVARLATALDEYDAKILRDRTTESVGGDFSRTWAVSRVTVEGSVQEQEAVFEAARQIFLALKTHAA